MNFDGETTVIDITAANVSSSYESVSLLKNMKLTNAERYIYTRYSSSLVDSVEALLSSIIIDEIFIPLPTNEQEELIRNNFFGLSEDYRTKIIFYDHRSDLF